MEMVAVVLAFVVGVAVGVAWRRPIARAVVARLQPAAEAAVATRRCSVCGKSANPLRTHDGRFLCAQHKGSAC